MRILLKRVAYNEQGLAKVGNSVLLLLQPMFCCLLKIYCLAHILQAQLLPSLMLAVAFIRFDQTLAKRNIVNLVFLFRIHSLRSFRFRSNSCREKLSEFCFAFRIDSLCLFAFGQTLAERDFLNLILLSE